MSIESSTQGPDEGEFVTLKQATPLVETKLIEEKSGDLVEKYGTKLPPGPPPAKLRRANKKVRGGGLGSRGGGLGGGRRGRNVGLESIIRALGPPS
jgi:hypothetical protein